MYQLHIVHGAVVSIEANFPSSFPLVWSEGLSNFIHVDSCHKWRRDWRAWRCPSEGPVAHFTARRAAITNKNHFFTKLCTDPTFRVHVGRIPEIATVSPGRAIDNSQGVYAKTTYIRSSGGKKDKPFGLAFVLTAFIWLCRKSFSSQTRESAVTWQSITKCTRC